MNLRISWPELRVMLWPHETRKENLTLWAKLIIQSIWYVLPPVYIIYYAWSVIPRSVLSIVMVMLMTLFTIDLVAVNIMHTIRKIHEQKLRANISKITKSMLDQLQTQHAAEVESIRTAAGRETLSDNPISIAAATLDILHKQTNTRTDARQNPLRSALDGTLLPEDLYLTDGPGEDTDGAI